MTEILLPTQWLANARRHLAAAKVLELHPPSLPPDSPPDLAADVGFHAQQCAECALKAVLIWREMDVPRTHDLQDLLSLIRTAGVEVPPELLQLAALTAFAVELRYADAGTVSAESARTAIRLADSALHWAQALIAG
ncbi:MAG TPA: HEPN domain-containing protein [Terriglobales bacterium]|nr:HEPN domain-containing protein [Terriglobales bacterium]